MESEIFNADFLRTLKNLLKIYFLLHFFSNLIKVFRECNFQYYKQLVESRF